MGIRGVAGPEALSGRAHAEDYSMISRRRGSSAAIDRLLELAGGRSDLVERAIVECIHETNSETPDYTAVEAKLRVLVERRSRQSERGFHRELA
jgi:hypothetical protein